MKHRILASIAAALLLAAATGRAEYHTFQIEQIFSNADGTVQFVVMHEMFGQDGENLWMGNPLVSGQGMSSQTFTFNKNLPGGTPSYGYGMGTPSPTAHKRVLIGTAGFAALAIVTPDFVVPNGFIPMAGGTLNYAGVDSVTFAALPTDGVTAIDRNGTRIQNLATNFGGQSASVTAAAPAAPIVPVAGVWWDPTESGSGYGLDYQNGVLIIQVYSYLAAGSAQWYLSAGPVANNVFTATLDKYTGGQCISCAYVAPTLVGNDGSITVTFTSPTTATVDAPGGRHFQIQRYFQ
jgi:hypothetical protein